MVGGPCGASHGCLRRCLSIKTPIRSAGRVVCGSGVHRGGCPSSAGCLALPHGSRAGGAPQSAVAGFLVRPQGGKSRRAVQFVQHRADIPPAQDQRLSQAGQVAVQRLQAAANERPVALGGVGLGPELGLDDIQRDHRAALSGNGQRAMVLHAEIALEPDQLRRTGDGPGHGRTRSAAIQQPRPAEADNATLASVWAVRKTRFGAIGVVCRFSMTAPLDRIQDAQTPSRQRRRQRQRANRL